MNRSRPGLVNFAGRGTQYLAHVVLLLPGAGLVSAGPRVAGSPAQRDLS